MRDGGQAAGSEVERERAYYDRLYSGFAQEHFAKPAVVAFREHLVRRILRLTGASRDSRVLSIGSGTGDTELLLAREVGTITGIDISPAGVEHANAAAARQGAGNAMFLEAALDDMALARNEFDVAIAVFFLHHLPDRVYGDLPGKIGRLLKPGGVLYALDPSSRRLSGAVGKILFPKLMKKYQTPGERPLQPGRAWGAFERAGFRVERSYYDFLSTPFAGLLPSNRAVYRAARAVDDALVRLPLVRLFSSNFEILAWKR